MTESLVSAFIIGLVGSVHCFGMCGGIVTLAGVSTAQGSKVRQFLLALLFNSGRLATYCLFGLVVGLTSKALFDPHSAHGSGVPIPQIISSVLLILIGIYVTRLWNSFSWLEKAGYKIYGLVQPLVAKILPVKTYSKAWLLGMTWGLMPCGMLYAAIAMSALHASPGKSTLYMLLFGLGTLPAMLSMTIFGTQINQLTAKPAVRFMLGLSLILLGIAGFFMGHGDHSAHGGHSTHNH